MNLSTQLLGIRTGKKSFFVLVPAPEGSRQPATMAVPCGRSTHPTSPENRTNKHKLLFPTAVIILDSAAVEQ